jgi:pimeloyl-ACP methyl ester carboxylesterase
MRRLRGADGVLEGKRGFGDSGPARRPASVRPDADDCRLMLDALEIDCAHVVGLSFAVACALELAAIAPPVESAPWCTRRGVRGAGRSGCPCLRVHRHPV